MSTELEHCRRVPTGLAVSGYTLPPTSAETLKQLAVVQDVLLRAEPTAIRTEHILHSGMYARTMRLPPGMIVEGALIKRATVLILNGPMEVFVDDDWMELNGYHVIPASAGRKQLFVSRGTVEVTMIFPTQAKTVAEAEAEFTDECELLQSRRMGENDLVIITGE